jgi:oligoendopeptidase F
VDYALKNYDQNTALTILAESVDYENYFTFLPMITEFENKAHELCRQETNVAGSDLNLLWTNLSKEYRSGLVDYYPQDSAQWTYISHIYYLSAGSSMTPPEKLRKFFGIEIDRKLFEGCHGCCADEGAPVSGAGRKILASSA